VKGAKAMKTKTHLILGCPASGTLPPVPTMPHNAARDPRFIKYLLGELPEPERTKLEDEYLGDDETFERLVAAEEELIYTYVRGGLSPTQHSGFERLFLQTPERRSRVEFATAFIACLEATAELSGT
jgi:hypothetical protein